MKVVALKNTRWCIAPRTSIDVVEGKVYNVDDNVASFLISGGLAKHYVLEVKKKELKVNNSDKDK